MLTGGLKKQQFTSQMASQSQEKVWGQSASTLRHNSPKYTFGKEKKLLEIDFNKFKPKFVNLPSSLNNKGTSIGYGKKQLFKPGYLKESLYKPSPNHYNIRRDFDVDPKKQLIRIQKTEKDMISQQLNQQLNQQQLQQVEKDRERSLPYSQQSSRRKRGKNFTFNGNGFYQDIRATSSQNSRNIQRYGQSLQQRSLSIQNDQFAIQHDFPIFLSSESQRGRTFQKAQQSQDINPNILYKASQYGKIMGVTVNPKLETKVPAPNAYNVQYNIGQDKQKVKLKSRSFSSYDNGNPSSNQYNIQDKLQQNGRFGSISLGFGKKYDFVKVRNRNPGPGSYEISGFADQIKNKYQNLNKMRLKNIQVKI